MPFAAGAVSTQEPVKKQDEDKRGGVMFSPATLGGHPELKLMGLAPLAVVPANRRKGVGSARVRAGLKACRQLGFGAVVVLGHPSCYPRFGFRPSTRYGIDSEYDAPEEAFMLIEVKADYLRGASGTVKFHAAFANL